MFPDMYKYQTLARSLFNQLQSKNILLSLNRIDNVFYDEPKFFQFQSQSKVEKKYTDGSLHNQGVIASGVSFNSTYFALLRCLGETIERFNQLIYRKKDLVFSKYNYSNKSNYLNLDNYGKRLQATNRTIGWTKGYDATNNMSVLIPAQLIYLNYVKKNEPFISTSISTGGASGVDHETTLIRGICEVVERDSFMNIYLNKIAAPKIRINKIQNKIIRNINTVCKRNHLEWHLFDISTDIQIPVFMSILIDRTGIGPAVSVGAKSDLDIDSAVIGSIEETMIPRLAVRNDIFKKRSNMIKIASGKIKTLAERGFFWSPIVMIKNLSFLLEQNESVLRITYSRLTEKEKLSHILKLLAKKNFTVYYANITSDFLKDCDLFTYKVIIPGLQPLYLEEKYNELNLDRLKTVNNYFGKKNFSVNSVPHPFL